MIEEFYYYTLPPYHEKKSDKDNLSEIDLNISTDYHVLFAGVGGDSGNLRTSQLERLEFIRNHISEMNLTAHFLESVKSISSYTKYDIECSSVYDAVISGRYGKYPISFFEDKKYSAVQEIILYYLVQKNHGNKRLDCFERALRDIFSDEVNFYYDTIKKILYISFVASDTGDNIMIYNICKYFFADFLMNIEVRWQTYPAVIGVTNYVIAAEGEQICGTII